MAAANIGTDLSTALWTIYDAFLKAHEAATSHAHSAEDDATSQSATCSPAGDISRSRTALTDVERATARHEISRMQTDSLIVHTTPLSDQRVVVIKHANELEEVNKTARAAFLGISPKVYFTHKVPVERSYFLVMEKYDMDLHDLATDSGVDFMTRLKVSFLFASLVARSHEVLGPHGDIKPENAVCSKEKDNVRLIDHQAGEVRFTPNYLSPERADKRVRNCLLDKDELLADDVYATALTVFAVITSNGLDAFYTCTQSHQRKALTRLFRNRSKPEYMPRKMRGILSLNTIVPESFKEKIVSTLCGAFLPQERRISSKTLAEGIHKLLSPDCEHPGSHVAAAEATSV
ncbi:MAG: hypothetical protein K9M07_06990 [Simkaniaceae bacterium]|nr:hypothetical protein [Simkaniaceae bacterium]